MRLRLRPLPLWVAGWLAFAGAGCSAAPVVSYEEVTQADVTGRLKFVMPRSLVKLDRKVVKDEPDRLVAVSVPTDAAPAAQRPALYAIIPYDGMWVKTRIKATYIDNTRLVSSIGVEVEDNRVKTIGEIAAVVAAIAPAIATLSKPDGIAIPEKLPVVIDPKAYSPPANEPWVSLPQNDGWFYRIEFESFSPDVVPTREFFAKHAKEIGVFPISACRDVTLYVSQNKRTNDALAFSLKTADPDQVMTIALPVKGKIDMHTACGVNVTSEKSDTASTWAVIGEIAKQAVAIKKTYEAKDSAPASAPGATPKPKDSGRPR